MENKIEEKDKKIIIGITHGDTNGVGYELIFKTFKNTEMFELCTPVVYGAVQVALYHRKALNAEINLNVINAAEEAKEGELNLLSCFDNEVKVDFGVENQEAGHAAFLSLEKGVEDLKAGKIKALVTAPINKASIQQANFRFAGHTEYLQNRLDPDKEPLMILMNDQMRVALVTTHLPIAKVAEAVTPELVEKKIRLLYEALKQDFILPMPRVAVLGLNPHDGDHGMIGREEEDIIKPVIKSLAEQGMRVFGPYPADGFFGAGMYRHFDGVLAMYHDQGLAPFKALCQGNGVNYTAGLSYVRTSPDHGTAYDIAGKGIADENSFRQAVYEAIDIYRNRIFQEECYRNPLKKYYKDRKEDEGRGPRKPHYNRENNTAKI